MARICVFRLALVQTPWIRWEEITKERAIMVFRPAAMAVLLVAVGALKSGCGESHARWMLGIAKRGFVKAVRV